MMYYKVTFTYKLPTSLRSSYFQYMIQIKHLVKNVMMPPNGVKKLKPQLQEK